MRLRLVADDDPGPAGPQGRRAPGAARDWAELVEMARRGDARTGAALFDRCEAQVNRIVWRVLGADDSHDDLVQQVFVALLKGLLRVRDPEAFPGWVAAVTVNTVRSELRRRRIRRLWLLGAPEALEQAAAPAPPHEARELLRRTYAVLEKLPSDERIAFGLRYVDEMPLAEVAEACDCSLATIKRRLRSAKARFRRLAHHDPMLAERLGEESDDGSG